MSVVAFYISSVKWWQDPSESEKALIGIQMAPMHHVHGNLLLLSFENKTPICQVRSLLHKLLWK